MQKLTFCMFWLRLYTTLHLHHQTYALHESCFKYFDGFSLPQSYNPNSAPNLKNFTIVNKIVVKEIVKVSVIKLY